MCLSLGIEPKQLRTLLIFFSKVLIAGDCLAGVSLAATAIPLLPLLLLPMLLSLLPLSLQMVHVRYIV